MLRRGISGDPMPEAHGSHITTRLCDVQQRSGSSLACVVQVTSQTQHCIKARSRNHEEPTKDGMVLGVDGKDKAD